MIRALIIPLMFVLLLFVKAAFADSQRMPPALSQETTAAPAFSRVFQFATEELVSSALQQAPDEQVVQGLECVHFLTGQAPKKTLQFVQDTTKSPAVRSRANKLTTQIEARPVASPGLLQGLATCYRAWEGQSEAPA